MHDAVLPGGLLGRAGAQLHHGPGLALGVVHLLSVAPAPGQDDLGVGQFALLPAQIGLGDPDHPLGRLLLHGERLLVGREVAAVPGDRAGTQVGDLVDPVQQLAVVADHDQHTRPGLDGRVQPLAGVHVEVVGRLVQEQHVGPVQQQRGQPQQHRLAARQLADGAVEADVAQAQFAQRGQGAFLDVPVVADGLEVFLAHVARLDGVQGGPPSVDAERLVDPQRGVERDVLRQVAHLAGHPDGALGRGEPAGDQLQQG